MTQQSLQENWQHKLFPYAYNILGSVEDAKDAIQDVLYNYLAAQKEVDDVKNYLIKSVINQSINIRNKKKRLQYGDMWLPEPVDTEAADTDVNLKEIASYSMMILMEQLSPKERAAFILKEAFDYSHQDISEVLDGTVENSRKLLSRAKTKLNPKHSTTKETLAPGTLDKFIQAIRGRDTKILEHLLSEDIAFYADGGNTVNVVVKMAAGYHHVADLLVFIYHKYDTGLTLKATEVNHQPALLYYDGARLVGAQIFGVSPETGKIFQISNVLDPDKLKHYKTPE
jgi:RNA polymerase sigma factor (sigma-70 family)